MPIRWGAQSLRTSKAIVSPLSLNNYSKRHARSISILLGLNIWDSNIYKLALSKGNDLIPLIFIIKFDFNPKSKKTVFD
jgi:hypothetical protein